MSKKESILNNHYSIGVKLMVAWYGIFQAVHVVFNTLYFPRQGTPIPFPSPPDGWSPQVVNFLMGITAGDLVNAILALVFVYGYFTKTQWSMWLGTMTLSISMYAAVVFTLGTIAMGAWAGNLFGYLWSYILFIPVVILFILFGVWAARGKLLDDSTKANGDIG